MEGLRSVPTVVLLMDMQSGHRESQQVPREGTCHEFTSWRAIKHGQRFQILVENTLFYHK